MPDGHETCYCGHVFDEHGGDPKHPQSLACTIEGCHCIHFEHNPDADEED